MSFSPIQHSMPSAVAGPVHDPIMTLKSPYHSFTQDQVFSTFRVLADEKLDNRCGPNYSIEPFLNPNCWFKDCPQQMVQQFLRECSPPQTTTFFLRSVNINLPHFVEAIMDSEKFSDVSLEDMGRGMSAASAVGSLPILQLLVEHPRFPEVPVASLTPALGIAGGRGYLDCFNTLLARGRLQDIPPEGLGSILHACALRQPEWGQDCIPSLINCGRFHEISHTWKRFSLEEAFFHKRSEAVDLLLPHVPLSELQETLETIRNGDHSKEKIQGYEELVTLRLSQ